MGLFDKFFTNKKISNYCLSKDQILNLITISNQIFNKEKINFEKQIFGGYIVQGDIPIEYQENEVALEKEFSNRYLLSSGIISIAIVEYLLRKKMDNSHNIELMIAIKQLLFHNILKIRKEIVSDPKVEENYFYDTENNVLETLENINLFSDRITLLSSDINSFVNNNGELNSVRNYFGVRIGQIMPSILSERDTELGELIKNTVKKALQNFEMYFFDLL